MSKNYAMVNGVKIELPDDVDELTFTRKPVEKEKKSPFARVKNDDRYFRIEIDGTVVKDVEERWEEDDGCYSVANYCTNKEMMEQRALHEILNRLLWRYREEHGGDNEWNGYKYHWQILKSELSKAFQTDSNANKKQQGVIYFKDKETAQSAIDEIVKPFIEEHPEFIW